MGADSFGREQHMAREQVESLGADLKCVRGWEGVDGGRGLPGACSKQL
jgi:hypothetical protein